MLNERNAIETMAISMRFSEPLGAVLYRRVESALQHTANRNGLIERVPIQGFQVNVANPSEVRAVAGTGMLFQQTSVVRNSDGIVQKQLTSQLDLQPTHLTYHTWQYRGWSEEKPRFMDIVKDPLQKAFQGAALGAIRVEYLDRFYFDGDSSAALIKPLLNSNCDWLPRHIFSSTDLWHSHTGRFANVSDSSRTLHLVNADCQDLTGPVSKLVGKRSVQLVTASEYQFAELGVDVASETVEDELSGFVDSLHAEVLGLFAQTVSKDFAEQNGLPS